MTGVSIKSLHPQQAFSLLEILVVLFIVVLLTSMVSLAVNSGGQDIRLQSQIYNLADVASYALDEAQLTGQDYGLLVREEFADGDRHYSYSWHERRLEGWFDASEGREVFAIQHLPVGISLELELEDAPFIVADLPVLDEDEENERSKPQVVFYSSGETIPGAINIRDDESDDLMWRLEWDLLGRIEVLRRGEAVDEDQGG